MTKEELRTGLIQFIGTIARPGPSLENINDDTNLIDEGYIDSLALVQIIMHLENNFGLDLRASAIDPNDLGTIGGMMNAVEQGAR
jgi:acyl carrier protein